MLKTDIATEVGDMAKGLPVGTVMVLHALARGHRYGFDLMEQTGFTSGTVYPALERLEQLGHARSHWEDAGVAYAEKRPPRRYFEITPEGKTVLIAALEKYRALAPLDIDGVRHPLEARPA
ncbi:MAG: helix-turn-helix transcriptional regulator [Gemmatimonadetes bacterium]|nr:helix-turn-helix transcriptional regulator [Gemmatimonadota bacterium]